MIALWIVGMLSLAAGCWCWWKVPGARPRAARLLVGNPRGFFGE